MSVKLTKNPSEANLITHDSKFHPDDVFSTMFLSKFIDNPTVYRTKVNEVPENPNAIIYDVGFGKFDHHGKDAKYRPNSKIKFCSFGLLWQEYGLSYLKEKYQDTAEELFGAIEDKLIKQIDGIDNGLFPNIEAEYKLLDLDQIIDLFNNTWEEDTDNNDNFLEAVKIAEVIFDHLLKKEYATIKAKHIVEEKIKDVKDNILILDKYMPYSDAIFESKNPKAKEIKIIILPSNRGGYNIKPITISKDSKELLINFPHAYRGCSPEELQKISGIKTARFVHSSGFLGCTETFEDALLLAKQALENKE